MVFTFFIKRNIDYCSCQKHFIIYYGIMDISSTCNIDLIIYVCEFWFTVVEKHINSKAHDQKEQKRGYVMNKVLFAFVIEVTVISWAMAMISHTVLLRFMNTNAKVSIIRLLTESRYKFFLVRIFASLRALRLATFDDNSKSLCYIWSINSHETQDHQR